MRYYAAILLSIGSLLQGCVNTEVTMLRYVSPAKYADYRCDQMREATGELYADVLAIRESMAMIEFDKDRITLSPAKKFVAPEPIFYRIRAKTEISQEDARKDAHGLIVMGGHLKAICRLASDRGCDLSQNVCALPSLIEGNPTQY